MCVTCGCSGEHNVTITNSQTNKTKLVETEVHTHTLSDGTVITHSHSHQEHSHHLSSPHKVAQIHAQMHGRKISLEQDILQKNNHYATQNRNWFQAHNILALNLVSSPGAGKTTLLTRTIQDLQTKIPLSVIEGDQETANDAQKIRDTGCQVVQINTGTGCHLEANMVQKGCQEIAPPPNSLVMIENVGNLVCPALFDLGESAKVVILSVTEGDDKPLKYPHMFRVSKVMILTKIDLLPYVQFDVERCLEYARQVNPELKIFQVSAVTGTGLTDWYEWLISEQKSIPLSRL
ncbi:MAG: hydrogenase nickel incorporation protein HypB [Xenococcus sp. (in: cyanobacteria)]